MAEIKQSQNEDKKIISLRLQHNDGSYTDAGKIINNFPVEPGHNYVEYKAEQLILIVNKFYEKTKEKLYGFFTLNEAWVIIETFNSYLYSLYADDKEVLEINIKYSLEYEGYGELYKADKEEMIKKIETLGELESFTVIRMTIEFWSRKKIKVDGEQLLKEIFGIA